MSYIVAGTRSRTTKSQSSAKNRTARTPASKRSPRPETSSLNGAVRQRRLPGRNGQRPWRRKVAESDLRDCFVRCVYFPVLLGAGTGGQRLELASYDDPGPVRLLRNWLADFADLCFRGHALEKPVQKLSTKIWLSITMIILFCACIFIFNPGAVSPEKNYFQKLIRIDTAWERR